MSDDNHHHHHDHTHSDDHAAKVKQNQEHFDEQSKEWDEDPAFAEAAKNSYVRIKEALGHSWSRASTTVLNFGCGNGLLENHLRHDVHQITGLDVSQGMIDSFQSKIDKGGWENVTAICGDILDADSDLPLEENSFDLILSCFVFHHLQDIDSVGKALVKYLKPNGGTFCLIEFSSEKEGDVGKFDEQMSESTKASLGSHDSFGNAFLVSYFKETLGLGNIMVAPAPPLVYGTESYVTVQAYGQRMD